jgi:D-tyrosyl-tRNA(Tyr) deacylase
MKIRRISLVCAAILLLALCHKPQTTTAMRLVVQRVKSASVVVEGHQVSQIGPGLLALVGLHDLDTDTDLEYCCKRLLACKLWANDNGGLWRHSVKQKGLSCLLVSQFTLYGTLSKKNQPDYKLAMKADPAEKLYGKFVEMVRNQYEADKVKNGIFGAMMDVELINDGPVTIIIESEPQAPTLPNDSGCTTDSGVLFDEGG